MSVTVRESHFVEPPKGSKGRRNLKIGVALVAVLAIGVGGGLWASTGDNPKEATDTAVVPKNSLAVGKASADLSLASKEVGGAPRRFPHTEAGAIEAASSAGEGLSRLLNHSIYENNAFLSDAFLNAPDISAVIEKKKAELGLGANGQLIHPMEGDRYYNEALFQYGAYRIDSSTQAEVKVSIWNPDLYGQGRPEDLENLNIQWNLSTYEMRWVNGDWRVSNGYGDDSAKAPLPADINRVDVSFKERRALLGPKWNLYQGATEKWPVDLLGPEPQGNLE